MHENGTPTFSRRRQSSGIKVRRAARFVSVRSSRAKCTSRIITAWSARRNMHAVMIYSLFRCVSPAVYIFLSPSIYIPPPSLPSTRRKNAFPPRDLLLFLLWYQSGDQKREKTSSWNFPASGSPRFALWVRRLASSADFWRAREMQLGGKENIFIGLPRVCAACDVRFFFFSQEQTW